MSEPSSLPWEARGLVICKDFDEIANLKDSPRQSAEVAANAALIVRAVNSHAELLETLKDAVHELECSGYFDDHPSLIKKRAVILKAEGKTT